METRISEEQGQALVRLARKTLEEYLGAPRTTGEGGMEALGDELLTRQRGVFVTLHKKGQLRGCIGFLEGREPVTEAVVHNAVNAAVRDPRFSPVRPSELAEIEIEVSVLTEPAPLEYSGPEDLLGRLRPEIDGVIVRSGFSAATFLPQVWGQLPGREDFLGQLCLKAGLPANAWRQGGLEVFTYQAQYFEEKA